MRFLEEAINDFYKQNTFYTSVKKYFPELKKQVVDYIRKKGVSEYTNYWGEPAINYNNLPSKADERRAKFHSLLKGFEVEKDFFAAKENSYYSKFRFPKFIYKNLIITLSIASNEHFFEDGHDLEINTTTKDNSHHGGREFKYKINIMRSVKDVMDDIWKDVENAVKKTAIPKEKTPATEEPQRRYVKSDISRIVDLYLNKQYKTYKSGKKVEIKDYDKKLVNFHVIMKNDWNKTYDSKGRGQTSFRLKLNVRKLTKNTKTSGSSWNSKTYLKPELAARFPEYKEWIEILREGSRKMNGRAYLYDIAWLFGEKSYSEDHLKIFDRLKMVTRKFIKLGYYPIEYNTPYKQGEFAEIIFKYQESLIKKVQKNPQLIDKIMNDKSSILNNAFFYKGQDPNRVYERCIKEVFSWK